MHFTNYDLRSKRNKNKITNLSGAAHRRRITAGAGQQKRRRPPPTSVIRTSSSSQKVRHFFFTTPRGAGAKQNATFQLKGRRQRKISPEQVQPMRSIGQAQRSTNQQCGDVCLPHGRPRAGNVSPKGGSVCTCIVSKQQYGGVLLFRAVARPCRSSLARAETIFCQGDYESLMIANDSLIRPESRSLIAK